MTDVSTALLTIAMTRITETTELTYACATLILETMH